MSNKTLIAILLLIPLILLLALAVLCLMQIIRIRKTDKFTATFKSMPRKDKRAVRKAFSSRKPPADKKLVPVLRGFALH